MFSTRAQGTIEYLIIISIIIVIALVVVGTLTTFTTTSQGTNQTLSQIKTQTGTIAITETSTNPDGNYLIRLQSNDPDNITITNVKIGDTNQNYTQTLPQGSAQNFEIDTTGICTTGTTTTQNITITYTTQYGITKTTILENVTFPCENYSVTTTATPTTEEEEADTTPPTITLQAPTDNNTITTSDTNINFIFTANETTTDCNLYIETSGTWYLADVNNQSIAADINKIIDANLAQFGEGDHYWDINCTDTSSNKGTATDRNINYTAPTASDTTPPTIYLRSPVNNDINANQKVTFDFNVEDDTNLSINQCTLYIDNVDVNSTPSMNGANGSFDFNFAANDYTDQIYDWNVTCSDGTNTGSPDANRQINLDINSYEITYCKELKFGMSAYHTELPANPIGYFVLNEDINCYEDTHEGGYYWNSGAGWRSITGAGDDFTGTFDGNNHSIYGLYMKPSSDTGLFSSIYIGGIVKNLNIVDADLNLFNHSVSSGCNYAGILTSYNFGTIQNVHVTGTINNASNVTGMITGVNRGTITLSSAKGNIDGNITLSTCSDPEDKSLGGIAGSNGLGTTTPGIISESFFDGNIVSLAHLYVGGIAGTYIPTTGTHYIRDVYVKGNITGQGTPTQSWAGGIVGRTYWQASYDVSNISRAYSAANVKGFYPASILGGGYGGSAPGGYLHNNVSLGDVNATNPASYVGYYIVQADSSGNGDDQNNYWYDSTTDTASACMAEPVTCTSFEKTDISYFKGDVSTSGPFDQWDFSGGDAVWQTCDNNFPILAWQDASVCSTG